MKNLFLSISCFLLSFLSSAQNWIKYIEFDSTVASTSVLLEADDGGIVMMIYALEKTKILHHDIIKLDKQGNLEWKRRMPKISGWGKGLKFYKGKREHYIIVFDKIISRNERGLGFIIFDKNGKIVREATLRDQKDMRIIDVMKEKKKICLKVKLQGDDGTGHILIFLSLDGDEVGYERVSIPEELTLLEYQRFIHTTPDSYFIPAKRGEEKRLFQVKDNEKIVWKGKHLVTPKDFRLRGILEYKQFKIAVTSLGNTCIIVSMDEKGEVVWSYKFNQIFYYRGGVINEKGDLVIGVGRPNSNPDHRGRLLKISANGEKIWERNLFLGVEDRICAFLPAEDGGFWVTGNVIDPNDKKQRVALFKLDREGLATPINGEYDTIILSKN